jgi:hypothetical protein
MRVWTRGVLVLSALGFLGAGCAGRTLGDGGSGDHSGEPGDPCEDDSDCIVGAICWNETCVQEGEMRVSLSWEVLSDFDLHVRTPLGSHIYFRHMQADHGELDVDDCVRGSCRDNNGTHVENVFFESAAPRGVYQVWVQNYDGRRAGDFEVEVAGPEQHVWTGTLPAIDGHDSQIWTVHWTD